MNQYDEMFGTIGIAGSIGRTSRLGDIPHFSEMVIPNPDEWVHRLGISESAIEQAVMNMERIAMALPADHFYERHFSAIEEVINRPGLSDVLEQHDRMLQNIGNALTLYGSMADEAAHVADAYSGIAAALEVFQSRISQVEELGLNYSRMASAVGLALQRISDDSELEVDDITRMAAECYEAETEEERNVLRAVIKPAQDEAAKTQKAKFSDIVKRLLRFLLVTMVTSLIDVGVQKILIKNPPEINQYYIQNITNNLVIEGYEVNELNDWGYRIVNREIILRARPGRSSYVTGHLQRGTIVRVIRKYKKWVEVTWTDENDESCIGWIQNYTLSSFCIQEKQ